MMPHPDGRVDARAPAGAARAIPEVQFLVAGGAKADLVRRVLEGPRDPEQCPAQVVELSGGQVRCFVDTAAAADLAAESPSAPDAIGRSLLRREP